MPVVFGEVTAEPAAPRSRGAESEASGGGEGGGEQPSEHDIERMVEMQANRYERVRAY
jgi:hypothetical protein